MIINITNEEFKEKMASGGVALDVRTANEVVIEKIDTAIHMDVTQPDFLAKVSLLDKSKPYLVYCRSGVRSKVACGMMEQLGFANIFNLTNGYSEWK